MIDLSQAQNVIAATGLVLLWAIESWRPFQKGHRQLRHAARNLIMGLLNAVAIALLTGPLIAQLAGWAAQRGVGLLHSLSLPLGVATLLALVLQDGGMYLWHRANHRVPLLWRFHRTHHSDPAMDVTTTVRFHPGEVILSSMIHFVLIPLFGISLWQILLYNTLLHPVIQLHHSNVRLPERWDRWLRMLITTPAIHRIHHSRVRLETDSNYSSIFSFWDRAGGTFRMRPDRENIQYGLDGYDREEWQRLTGLLQTPFTAPTGESVSRPANPRTI